MSDNILAKRLRQARAVREFSLREVADAAGISAQAIHMFERGKKFPCSSTLMSVAKALDVSLDYLCSDDPITGMIEDVLHWRFEKASQARSSEPAPPAENVTSEPQIQPEQQS